jgi:transketolase C-terminal domain/subunit
VYALVADESVEAPERVRSARTSPVTRSIGERFAQTGIVENYLRPASAWLTMALSIPSASAIFLRVWA